MPSYFLARFFILPEHCNIAHFVPWAALEAAGVVGGITGISFRDLLPKAPLDKETIDKLEPLDFLRADVFNRANKLQSFEYDSEDRMLRARHGLIAKDKAKAEVNITQVLSILQSLQLQMCAERQVPSPTKEQLVTGSEKLLRRTPRKEQLKLVAHFDQDLTKPVAKVLCPATSASSPTAPPSSSHLDAYHTTKAFLQHVVASGSANELLCAGGIWQSYKFGCHHHTNAEPKTSKKSFVTALNSHIAKVGIPLGKKMKKAGYDKREYFHQVNTE